MSEEVSTETVDQKVVSRTELNSFRDQYGADYPIASVTPTVCALLGLPEPAGCGADPIAAVVDQAVRANGDDAAVERMLIFCADAVGETHRQKYPEQLNRVEKLAGIRLLSSGVMPSCTPVSFASIFSGASPKVHGIQKYEKPVLRLETLFDILIAAGKRVTIVATNSCSMDMIFRKRDMEYYSAKSDERVWQITEKLVEEDAYDVIVCYCGGYDDRSHGFGSDSPEALGVLDNIIGYFESLVATVDRCWGDKNRVVAWVADHGNHDLADGTATHGFNIFEDMVVNHFYRVRSGKR